MPVSSTHPEYDKYCPLWEKVRIVCEGEESVKKEGYKFLPILSGQDAKEYEAYKERAMFYGASARTVQGLTGAIFRKSPDIKFPEKGLASLDSVGIKQESLLELSKAVVRRAVGIGRVGILVDSGIKENSKPYITLYEAENIINWQYSNAEDGEVASEIVLLEISSYRDEKDPFVTKTKKVYRVLRLGDPSKDSPVPDEDDLPDSEIDGSAIYYQDLYQEVTVLDANKKESTNIVYIGRTIPKLIGGKTLNRIPFWCVNAECVSLEPQKPPILDLVNVNISHYKNSADLEHGRHYTALPTAWVAGFDPKSILTIGASRAWVSSETDAKAGFLEFTGAGLGHLADGMASKEKLMAILGARMLEELPVGTEAAEAVRLRQSGEASALSAVALTCSAGITQALKVYAEWLGYKSDEIKFILNRDFNTSGLAPNVLQNLIMAVQGGLVSWNTFFYNLKKGELVPEFVSEDEELKFIKKGASMFVIEKEPAVKTDKRIKKSTPDDQDG